MSCARGCCPDARTHYLSISISAAAMPSRNGPHSAYAIQKKEDGWERDMPAYKRLRDDGLQPKRIDGAAEIESKAETPIEVESGRVLTPIQRKQYAEVMDGG